MARHGRRKDAMSEMGPTADSESTAHLFTPLATAPEPVEGDAVAADGVVVDDSVIDAATADAAWIAAGEAVSAPAAAPSADLVPGSVVDDLRLRLVELQSTVERLVNQTPPEHEYVVPPAIDPEIESASRTLRFAQQTADSAVAEAREEAQAILAAAQRERQEIIAVARRDADVAFAAERDRVAAAAADWETQRTAAAEQVDALAEALSLYRDRFADLEATLADARSRLRPAASASAAPVAVADEHDDQDAGADVVDITDAASAPRTSSSATNF